MLLKKINILFQSLFLMVLITVLFKPFSAVGQAKVEQKFVYPAQEWLDNKNNPINAHGGGLLFYNGIYYWYGEHKLPGKSEKSFADGGIHCYSSSDLMNWVDVGVVLSVDFINVNIDLEYGCLIERPKVVQNKKTGKFIAYFKFYPKGSGYEVAYVGVAIADSPVGPFRYSHKFLGAGSPKGSGDFSMFVDDNGDLYHFAVRKPDKVFVMTKMRDDYLLPIGEYEVCKGIEIHTEAPAIIKINGTYHLLGSGSSGWNPNAARYYTSTSLNGTWMYHGNPCSGTNSVDDIGKEKTFGAQSCFIFPVTGLQDAYVAMFDIWKPATPIKGRYVWLPLQMNENKLLVNWVDKWDLTVFEKK